MTNGRLTPAVGGKFGLKRFIGVRTNWAELILIDLRVTHFGKWNTIVGKVTFGRQLARPRRFVCGSLLCFIVVEDEVDELQIQVYLDLSVLMSLNQIKLLDYDIFGNSQQLQVHVQISEILH